MLKELLGIREGILEDLHQDHQEVSTLIERILAARSHERRAELFKELKAKLLAHAGAEEKVLYRRMTKSADAAVRRFALEGGVEHETVEGQLDRLSRSTAKDGEAWTARLTVLRELIDHHVREEESTGFADARKEFDGERLRELGEEFRREKERLP
jgi:hemerythrin-like domain-containing protein